MHSTPTVGRPDGGPMTTEATWRGTIGLSATADTGFAQLGPFGSDIATPAIDRLAAESLRDDADLGGAATRE